MQTIRLTFSPYGYGRFTKVVRVETPTDEEADDEALQRGKGARSDEGSEE